MRGVTDTGTILIRGARQLLTLRGPGTARRGADLNELAIIQDGAVLVRDGKLVEVGSTRRVENLADARTAFEINAAGRVLMPGFVDCHTHLVFPTADHGESDLEGAVHAIRTSTAKRLAARTRMHLHSMARHGTTTVEAKTGCGPDARAEIKLLRTLASLRKHPLEVLPSLLLTMPDSARTDPARAQEISDWYARELLPKVRQKKLAFFADAAWETDAAIHESIRRYLQSARGCGFGCRIHADKERPADAIRMAVENSALSVDHLECAANGDAALLSGSQTIATFLPYAAFRGRGGRPPARAAIDAGVAVALATNFNPGHTPNLSMQTVVALACLQMGLTPEEAISSATINGAHALGCAARTGSLEPGKSADLLLLNTSDYREIAHHFGMNLVHLTMKSGEFIYKEGEVRKRSFDELRPPPW